MVQAFGSGFYKGHKSSGITHTSGLPVLRTGEEYASLGGQPK